MRIPIIRGTIDRRILANFRIDPEVMARNLPRPFRPKLVNGYAVAGICLIRLVDIRPRFLPLPIGIGSENAAHRVAVEWNGEQGLQQGVFIPRRDTSSRMNALVGGRLFPGIHHLARFEIEEGKGRYSVSMDSEDGETHVAVSGTATGSLPAHSVFESLGAASEFFEMGSLGYSTTRQAGRFDGLELRCKDWKVEALAVDRIASSYFEDHEHFPSGSVEFDDALLMRNIQHEWHGRQELRGSQT